MTYKISFISALVISLNIMLGSGIFINTVLLAQTAGSLGMLSYLVGGIIIFPLIFVIRQLLTQGKGGTFYDFGSIIHPFIGFISSWSYFTAKIASAALGTHIFVSLMQLLFPLLSHYNALTLDSIIIIFFGFLNILNIRIGSIIQRGFLLFKLFPILLVIISGIFLFSPSAYTSTPLIWNGVTASIPFILFAFSGFEAVCSLSQSIENHQKNGPRAIFYAFILVLTILCLYQFSFFGALGTRLSTLSSYKEAFPLLIAQLYKPQSVSFQVMNVLSLLGIACSSLGASYGIFYSNAWNLYTLAQKNHFPRIIATMNRYSMPVFCSFIQMIGALAYIWVSQGDQIPLQQISASGSTAAYTLSALSFTYGALFNKKQRLEGFLGLGSCIILIGTLIKNGLTFGFRAYGIFLLLCIIGSFIYLFYPKLAYFKGHKSQKT